MNDKNIINIEEIDEEIANLIIDIIKNKLLKRIYYKRI